MLEATVTVKLINVCSEEITQVSPKVATSKAISFVLEITEIIVTTSFTKLIHDLFLNGFGSLTVLYVTQKVLSFKKSSFRL